MAGEKIAEKRCFNQRSREITTVRRCKIIPFRQITQPNNSRSNCMGTLLNENLVFELKGGSHLGELSAGAFPGPELWSSAQGLPSARGSSCFFLCFSFQFMQPRLQPRSQRGCSWCLLWVSDWSHSQGGCLPHPATGSAGQEHCGSSSRLCGCSQLQQGKNGDRST